MKIVYVVVLVAVGLFANSYFFQPSADVADGALLCAKKQLYGEQTGDAIAKAEADRFCKSASAQVELVKKSVENF